MRVDQILTCMRRSINIGSVCCFRLLAPGTRIQGRLVSTTQPAVHFPTRAARSRRRGTVPPSPSQILVPISGLRHSTGRNCILKA
jgi:hypothetical protein